MHHNLQHRLVCAVSTRGVIVSIVSTVVCVLYVIPLRDVVVHYGTRISVAHTLPEPVLLAYFCSTSDPLLGEAV